MLSKKVQFNIGYLAIIFLLGGILHVLLRNVDFTDCFSQVFYGCVVLLWSATISERITNQKVRHILYNIIFFMEMYFTLQICKYRLFFNNRTVWAYYYIPMLIIPFLLFYLALSLNRRELEVLRYVAAGYSDKEIAQMLVISFGTVRVHLNNLLQKTACASRTELAILVAKTGIVVAEI